jgi:hypothetical protein
MNKFNKFKKIVICLQILTTLWIGKTTTSLSYWMYIGAVMLDRNTHSWAISIWSQLFDVDIAIAKFKRYKSPSSCQFRAKLIQTREKILRSEIHKVINSVQNKEELRDQWKESIIATIYKMDDKSDCDKLWKIIAINFIHNFIPYFSLKVKSAHRWSY